MKNKFLNNKSTTLVATLTAGVTSLPAASLSSDIIGGLNKGESAVITITDTAGTTSTLEIIYVTNYNVGTSTYTIARAQEGTGSSTWVSGSKVSIRITGGILNKFITKYYSDSAFDSGRPDAQANISTSAAVRTNSSSVLVGIFTLNAAKTFALLGITSGTTAASEPTFVAGLNLDGTGVQYAIPIDPTSLEATSQGVIIGDKGITGDSLSLVLSPNIFAGSNVSGGDSSILIGSGISSGSNNITIGNFGTAIGDAECISLGNSVNISSNAITTRAIGTKEAIIPFSSSDIKTNLESIIWSGPLDFTGGVAWTASTAITHGFVRRPTTANGLQYYWIDDNYTDGYSKKFPATYTSASTGSTQPTWPTTDNSSVADGGGSWFASLNVGHTITLPEKFLVTEIGILVFSYSAVTVQPTVSFGVSGNNTFFTTSAITTGLTGVDTCQVYRINNTKRTTTLTISINTLATGTRMLGQVYFKGFYVPDWF